LDRITNNYIKQKKRDPNKPNMFTLLRDDVREKCREDMEFIKSKQVISLTDYYKKWGAL